MRGRNGGEQNLSKEQGPLGERPLPPPPKNVPRDGGRWKNERRTALYTFQR